MNKNNQSICEINSLGTKRWLLNDQLHREDGPALEFTNGSKEWCFHGQYHRLDGPAVEHIDGYKAWYIHDQRIDCSSQEEFEKKVNINPRQVMSAILEHLNHHYSIEANSPIAINNSFHSGASAIWCNFHLGNRNFLLQITEIK